ncbi:MAG: DDE-type integrase/transposase/recombinase [Lachnospiraceae bacterium]|nr:DDE-type integrase/transposase/recombinase [Lachnospiraceae bacterium]
MKSKEIRNWQDSEALRRYQMIMPLLDPDADEGRLLSMREDIAKSNGVSIRTIYRYEAQFRADAFDGLRPKDRTRKRSDKLPANFEDLIAEAILLKREVPKRSVRVIIKILELEGRAAPGILKESTVRRYLYQAGLGVKQMKRTTEKREATARRFCRPHRMELIQGDIKYGPMIRTRDGKLVKTYLSSLIDDHSRYILQAEFYDNQRQEIVEDTFHKAILKFGAFECAYLDNGTQYISGQLEKSCARLSLRLLHAKPRACESKGKVEKYHQKVDKFIAELAVSPVHSVEELNEKWKYYLEQEYQKVSHDGIKEYYRSYDVEVPACGITPEQEFYRDTRGLVYLDTSVVSEAFCHHEERTLDKAGCFSFEGKLYEASTSLAGAQVEISYDPLNTSEIMVHYQGIQPIRAHRVEIGAFADKKQALPIGMTNAVPETSRLLDALEKKYKEDHRIVADALSFRDYGKDGGRDV